MYGHKSPRTVRPYPYRNGSHIHRKGKEDLEEPGESHAVPNHRHIWTKEEVEAVTDLQREFNDYLICSVRLSLCRPDIRLPTTR